jgi:hypothetical protein
MFTGAVFMYHYSIFEMMNNADVTKISFLILFLFVFFTYRVGIETFHASKESRDRVNTATFFSNTFLTMGMIGTVFGFIYMLKTCFVAIDASNSATMQAALIKMSHGMGTALFTTASGLVCSLLLKLQLFNLEQAIKNDRK